MNRRHAYTAITFSIALLGTGAVAAVSHAASVTTDDPAPCPLSTDASSDDAGPVSDAAPQWAPLPQSDTDSSGVLFIRSPPPCPNCLPAAREAPVGLVNDCC
jgi:hypothetical protein